MRNLLVAAPAGIRIRYTGQRLTQRDADVFLHLLARANSVPLGQPAPFTAHSLLLDLGWDTSSRGYARLRDSILKLSAGAVECEWTARPGKRVGYAGSLIAAFACKDGVTGRALREWTIRLEPELVRLFDDSHSTPVGLRARRLLGNHELAKWLHGYLASHHDIGSTVCVAKLRELSGSRAKTLFGFRRTLRRSLDVLLERRLVEGYVIDPDKDLVRFGLPGSGVGTARRAVPLVAASRGSGLMAYATTPLAQFKHPR